MFASLINYQHRHLTDAEEREISHARAQTSQSGDESFINHELTVANAEEIKYCVENGLKPPAKNWKVTFHHIHKTVEVWTEGRNFEYRTRTQYHPATA